MAFTDDFNRSDNADLGANWTPMTGEFSWVILTNQARTGANTDSSEVYSATQPANDQFAQVKLVTIVTDGVGTGSGVMVRASNSARTYYGIVCRAGGTELRKQVAASYSFLARETANAWTGADISRLEVVGTTLTVKRNGTTISALTTTDASIASGFTGLNHSGTTTIRPDVDDFQGGDISAGTAIAIGLGSMGFTGLVPVDFILLPNDARIVIRQA